jgi:CRISPR system Cascade subunit CasE
MTYLSRLILNPRSRQVRNELADPYEMHRTVMKAFAGNLQDDERVLFRLDVPRTGIPTLLVQSKHEPDWVEFTEARKNYLLDESYLPFGEENLALKEINFNKKLKAGQRLSFRLRANPVKRIKETRKRVGLHKEEVQLDWLKRKLNHKNSTQLLSARVVNENDQHGKLFKEKDKKKQMKFHAVLFEGILEITDKDEFQKMLEAGIGPGKGLGFGLLSLAPSCG